MREESRHQNLSDERGAAAVEFALIIWILVMIFVATAKVGGAYGALSTYNNWAGEAARLAAIRTPQDEVEAQIEAWDAADPVHDIGGSIAVDECGEFAQNTLGTVSWEQPLDLSIPFIQFDTPPVTIKAVFKCE